MSMISRSSILRDFLATGSAGFLGPTLTLLALFLRPEPASAFVPGVLAGVAAGLIGAGVPGFAGLLTGAAIGVAATAWVYSPLAWVQGWLLAFLMLELRGVGVMLAAYLVTRVVLTTLARRRA